MTLAFNMLSTLLLVQNLCCTYKGMQEGVFGLMLRVALAFTGAIVPSHQQN